MRPSHARRAVSVRFDDPNLVSCAGLAAVLAPAARCGLRGLVTEGVRIAAKGGANAAAKIVALAAGMVAGADSINDMDLLRHGGMGRLFDEVRRSRRWARSYAYPPSVTSASSTRSPLGSSRGWLRPPQCCPGLGSWASSMSMTRCGRPMVRRAKTRFEAMSRCFSDRVRLRAGTR